MATPRRLLSDLSAVVILALAQSSFAQLAPEQLVTRTYKLRTNNPVRTITAAELQERFAGAGIKFPTDPLLSGVTQNGNAMFLNERTGVLIVRTTLSEIDKVEALLDLATPPIVQVEARFIEMGATNVLTPFKPNPQSFTNLTIYTERQSRSALEKFERASGVNVLTPPSVMTISGRQVRLRAEEARTLQYDTPPRLPRDTRPDADPTPYNKGRLPFPPTFGT